ncbi:hypothetical protein D3C77_655100 [compost metagenome]
MNISGIAFADIADELQQLVILQQFPLQLRSGVLRFMDTLDFYLGHNIALEQRVEVFVLGNLAQIVE